VEVPIEENEEEGHKVAVHQQNDDSNASAEDCEFIGCFGL